jgi:hypothetical protein
MTIFVLCPGWLSMSIIQASFSVSMLPTMLEGFAPGYQAILIFR